MRQVSGSLLRSVAFLCEGSEDHFAAAGLYVAFFADAHAVFVIGGLLSVEGEFVAGMGLCHVGNLESTDTMSAVPVEGPEIEHVLDIFHGVDVAVDVNIIIKGVDGVHKRGIVGHFYTTTLVDGTLLIVDDPVVDGAIVNGEDIGGLARLGVDHRPDRTTVAVDLSIVADNTEVARGEVAHGTLHPGLDIKLRVLHGHLVHLDGKAREHPRAIDGHEIFHAKPTGRGVEVGSVEHMIAEVAHEEPLREVAMERFSQKFVRANFIH